jgi:hypothetical protein
MVDLSAIAGMATSMRAAIEITKAMKDVHDANLIQTKTFELTREIMAAQSYAMEAMQAQTALLATVRDLEEKISKLETWNAEKARYELREVSPGVLAYTMKAGTEQGQPSHMLCANCYDRGTKSVIQSTQELQAGRRMHICPHCKSKIPLSYPQRQSQPATATLDFDPFTGR